MATNWANTPGPKPGNSNAVNAHKSIASGMTMPASPRKVKTQLKGSSTGCAHVPGLYRG